MVEAAIYCRRSTARYGDTTHVDDQRKICLQLAEARGWHVDEAHIYVDNAVSAWKRNRKRPGWDALLKVVDAGGIQAIIVYHGDRLIRQPRDLEDLIDLARGKGVRLASPTGDRDFDNPDDQYVMTIEAAHARREVENTSRRMKRRYVRLAEAGLSRPGGRGGRAFGFASDGVTHRDEEAEALRDAAKRVLDHEFINQICRDWNAAGLRTTAGKPWTHSTLKKSLLRPRVAGLLEREGKIVGKAAWEPILEEETWRKVVRVLTDKGSRFAYATNTRRYLLTGIAICGTCEEPLAIRHNTRSESLRGYGCINPECKRKVHRNVGNLDRYVEGRALRLLSDEKFIAELLAMSDDPDLAAEIAQLEERRTEAQEVLENLADHPGVSPQIAVRSLESFTRRIGELRARMRISERQRFLSKMVGISREQWDGLPLAWRRQTVDSLFTVRVLATGKRGPGFDPASVDLRRRKLS